MSLSDFFVYCSGASRGLLNKCPESERTKYVGVGTMVFFTGLFAFISFTYAMSRFTSSLLIAGAIGLAWACFIFAFDRYVVSSMRKHGSRSREILDAFPRFFLALVFAFTIAVPLEVRFAESRIQRQIAIMKQRDVRADQEFYEKHHRVQELRSTGDALSAKLDQALQQKALEPTGQAFQLLATRSDACRSARDRLDQDGARQLQPLTATLERLREAIRQETSRRQRLATRGQDIERRLVEIDGALERAATEPSLVQEVARQKDEAARNRRSVLQEIQASETHQQELVQQRGGVEAGISALRRQLQEKQAECDQLLGAVDSERRQYKADVDARISALGAQVNEVKTSLKPAEQAALRGVETERGVIETAYGDFLTQVEALGAVTGHTFSTLWWARWLLSFIFILVETAPIMAKLLSPKGPYDHMLEAQDLKVEVEQRATMTFYREDAGAIFVDAARDRYQRRVVSAAIGKRVRSTVEFLADFQRESSGFVRWFGALHPDPGVEGLQGPISTEEEAKARVHMYNIFRDTRTKALGDFQRHVNAGPAASASEPGNGNGNRHAVSSPSSDWQRAAM